MHENRDIHMAAKVGKPNNTQPDGWIIIKVISGEFKAYNAITNTFSSLQNSNATIFNNKDKALDVVSYLCDKNRTHPVFLSAVAIKS